MSQSQSQGQEYHQEKLTYDDLTHLRIAIALFESNPDNKDTLTKMYESIPELKEKINRMWEKESKESNN